MIFKCESCFRFSFTFWWLFFLQTEYFSQWTDRWQFFGWVNGYAALFDEQILRKKDTRYQLKLTISGIRTPIICWLSFYFTPGLFEKFIKIILESHQLNPKKIQNQSKLSKKKPIFKTFKFDVWRENVGWYISYANFMIDAYYITHKFCYLTLNSSQFSEIASRLLSVTFPQPFNLKVLSLFRFFTRLSTALSFTSLHSDRSIASREGQFSVNDLMPVSVTPLHLAK